MEHPLAILKKYWDFDSFRPLQGPIIESVLDGKDTLALLPTGGGKSLCYQVPALCLPGVALVISPLIALMKDQVEQLKKRKIPAAAIYSGMPYAEIDRVLDNAVYGDLKLLYLSPERLTTDLALERIRRMQVSLLAVDEAHCISQWGYDFRPAYLNIGAVRELIPKTPVLALTATAIPEVVTDIQEKLQFPETNVFQKSFARPNLSYIVRKEENKIGKLADMLKKQPGTAIVYVRNRRKTQEVALQLQRMGFTASFYHAGLEHDERAKRQDEWMQGTVHAMVCTNAFGMGIDKPDVRLVVHLDLPDSPEAYFQEAGRAGRDEKRSYAVLLYDDFDVQLLEENFSRSFPDPKEIRRVYQALGSYLQLAVGSGAGVSYNFDLAAFSRAFEFNPREALAALKVLEQAGWITLSDAVYIPGSFFIRVTREELYDFELKNPAVERILKAMLRTYTGAFQQYVSLREDQLARFLRMEKQGVVTALQAFHRAGIIDYRPPRDAPQLTFLLDRVDARNVQIDRQWYDFRKKRSRERIDQMIAYVRELHCRSQQLVGYFGEKDAPRCGHCDVCREHYKSTPSGPGFDKLKDRIRELVLAQKLDEKALAGFFRGRDQARIPEVLAYLMDEGWLAESDGKLVWNE
ncbi:MAG: RecQ family ATP-dependent DNA helicase [Lewinellaceae bacterium]|nr:RecQ family ATP-dependent DNA helicase [Lewinellaceae bacterium]